MTVANVIFIAGLILTAIAIIVSLARAALGNAWDAELKQERVDAADERIEVRGRIARSALHRSKRQRVQS